MSLIKLVLWLIIMVMLYWSAICMTLFGKHMTLGTVLVYCVRAVRSTAPAASDAPDEFDVQLECGQFRLARLCAPSQ